MSTTNVREVTEGLQIQGIDEVVVYTIDVTNVGDTPSSPSLVVKDENDSFADVTSVVAPDGSASASLNIITLPKVKSLTMGRTYRCEVLFTLGGNTLEHYFRILAER